MTIYATRGFSRWARGQGLKDSALCKAVADMENGLYEADLGDHLLKKRIARAGQGKRGGFRTLVATSRVGLWFFLYGFAKNERGNINRDEEAALKRLAAALLRMPLHALSKARDAGELLEVICDA